MTTFQDSPQHDAEHQEPQQALARFRARAQQLFEAQQARVRSLEKKISEQLDGIDEAVSATESDGVRCLTSREEQELRGQLAQARKLLNVRADELKKLRAQVATAIDGDHGIDAERLLEELSDMRMERDQLVARVADAEHQAQRASEGDAAQLDELRQRFEKAVQEIRELKTKNASLESRSTSGARAVDAPVATGGAFDWEEQKRRLMDELGGEEAPESADERLSIESTIRITDEVVLRKDREIADLRAMLNDPGGVNRPAEESGAIAEVLDHDEVIQAEREKLSRLQDEWREKLRQAEIDISVERAKLARERAELQERVRAFESDRAAFESEVGGAADERKPAGQQTGRWLSRLGLKDEGK